MLIAADAYAAAAATIIRGNRQPDTGVASRLPSTRAGWRSPPEGRVASEYGTRVRDEDRRVSDEGREGEYKLHEEDFCSLVREAH